MLDIKITKTTEPKEKPAKGQKLGFGKIFTDHMFVMNYTEGKGWHDARIEPFHNISLSPAAMVYHYGQEMFEGLKAYKNENGEVFLFRPDMNAKRTNATNDRLVIPQIPIEDFVQAVSAVVDVDRDWIPTEAGTSLYIRPFIIATDEFLGVAPSKTYLFMVILSPSGAYYESGLAPVGIWIEDEYVRAVRGGIGFAKTGGNYAASLIAQQKAHDAGYSQVLWLDGVDRKYIEEVGAMNIFFKIAGKVVTPALSGSILPGITRNSVIEVCKSWGYDVQERKISVDELIEAQKNGTLEEVWGTGTAAVISPVGKLRYGNEVMTIQNGETGELSLKLYDTITGIQLGRLPDTFGWRVKVGK
jgi:branched-chain amino acid aminotransferase